jgi:hypothetical protein
MKPAGISRINRRKKLHEFAENIQYSVVDVKAGILSSDLGLLQDVQRGDWQRETSNVEANRVITFLLYLMVIPTLK